LICSNRLVDSQDSRAVKKIKVKLHGSPMPPLAGGKPGELIELEDDLVEDPTLVRLRGEKEQVVEIEQNNYEIEEYDENDTLAIL
jgi:hypothetical protein